MAWRRFAKIEGNEVIGIIQSEHEEVDGFIDVTGRGVRVGSLLNESTGEFGAPHARDHEVIKSLVLITKAAIQAGIIPLDIVQQEAKDIWQRVKENRQ